MLFILEGIQTIQVMWQKLMYDVNNQNAYSSRVIHKLIAIAANPTKNFTSYMQRGFSKV